MPLKVPEAYGIHWQFDWVREETPHDKYIKVQEARKNIAKYSKEYIISDHQKKYGENSYTTTTKYDVPTNTHHS